MVAPKVKRRRLAALKKSADAEAARLVEEAAQAETLLRETAAARARQEAVATAKVKAAAAAAKEAAALAKKSVKKSA